MSDILSTIRNLRAQQRALGDEPDSILRTLAGGVVVCLGFVGIPWALMIVQQVCIYVDGVGR